MGKRRRVPESDGTTSASGFKTVVVETSLYTHLALTLSFSDTVGDFKRKIMLQHEQCFPNNGAITVHSLKIKYRGKLYHLHESDMLVSSAFEGFERRWYLYVDASSSLENVKEQNDALDSSDNGKSDIPMLPLLAIDAISLKSPGESSQHTGSEVGRVNGTFQEGFSSIFNQKLIESDTSSKDDSKDQNEKLHSRDLYEARSGGDLKAKKKQKVRHSLHVSGESALNVLRTSPQTAIISSRSNDEAARLEDSFVGSGPKVSTDVQQESNVIEKKEVYRHHSEDLSIKPQVSDLENLSLEMSVMVNKEVMASPDVPSPQVHMDISPSTKKKKKIKKQLHVTNSYVPSDNEGGQILHNDESMLTLSGNVQNEYKEEDVQLSSKHNVLLSEVKTSDLVKTTLANREVVFCVGILDTYPETDNSEVSKSKSKSKIKIKKSKKFAMHDLSAPGSHIEDQSMRDEDVLTQNDPKKIEMNSELAKNLDSDETILNAKDSASDIVFNVRNDPECEKSGSKPKKKKMKKSSSKSEYLVVERIKYANDSSGNIMAADQSIEGKKEQKIVDSPKNGNNDGVNLPLTVVNHIQSRNEDVDLNSGKDSNFDQTRDKAIVQDQVNNDYAEETKIPMDQTDRERKNNKGTTPKKRKKKAKRTDNSTSENLSIIPESDNINDKELDSLVEKLCDVDYTDTMKVNGSEEKQTFYPSGASVMGPPPNNVGGQSQHLLESGDNPKVPANEIESNCEVNLTVVNTENNSLVYEGGNSSVYFRHYFVSGDDHKEAASNEKVDGESKVIEADEHKISPEGKLKPSKSSGNQKNSRKRSKSLNKSVEPAAVMDNSEEKNGSLNSSNLNSVSRDSKQIIINKSNQKKTPCIINLKSTPDVEVSRKKVKDLDKKSSQSQEKSLLTTPGLSESSGDENVNLKSGSFTQSPADSSSLSLSLSEDLMREGSINKDYKGGKTPLGSKSEEYVDTKKAKFTASQSAAAADTNSQHVDFVPESQPI